MIDTGGTLPFEGSAEIAGIVTGLIRRWKVTHFVETGTQRGATALWAAQFVKSVTTIESDAAQYAEAVENLKGSHVSVLPGDSSELLSTFKFFKGERVLLFLDAHSMCGTPIVSEIRAIGRIMKKCKIAAPVICVHDIEVPGHPLLGFDHYEDGTVLNLALIEDALADIGIAKWPIKYNSTPDGAARGFCYITPKER